MQTNASPENRAIFEEYKKIIRNIHQAKESGIILPLVTDESGNKMFQFDVQNVTGKMSYDPLAIIEMLNKEILLCLFADILALGQEGGGSFSLAEGKMQIINMSIESKLDEIKSQLNHQLIPTLFAQNGWDLEVTPLFDHSGVAKLSLDEASKFIQRVSATGNFPKTPQTINWVMEVANIPYRVPDDTTPEELKELLGDSTSRSGDGMATPGEGTAINVGPNDNSVGNNENASTTDYRILMQDEEFVTVEMNGRAVLWMAEDWNKFIGEEA